MSNNNDDNITEKERILIPSGTIIDKNIYLFLFALFKKIIIKDKNSNKEKEEKLKNWINKMNNNIINKQNKFINLKYDIKNFRNIIDFVKSQNKMLAGDILEDLLILIFSKAFQTEKTNTFGEFIYNDNQIKSEQSNYESKLEQSNNSDLVKWFKTYKFIPSELKNLEELLKDSEDESGNKIIQESPLYYILSEILKLKIANIKKIKQNKKMDKYIYIGVYRAEREGRYGH